MRQYLQLNPYLEKPKPQPFARVNLDFTSPNNFGPDFSGFHPLESISLSLLYTYEAGAFDTYNPNNIPGVQNNIQWKDNYNVDLRLIKEILNSAHAKIMESSWKNFLIGYKSVVGVPYQTKIVKLVSEIESRGRYAQVV